MNYADEIKRFRKERGLNQTQFAELVGVDQPSVSRWERGGAIRSENLAQLSLILGISVEDFLGIRTLDLTLRVKVVGQVEAGVWREAMEFSEDDQYITAFPRPRRHDVSKAFGLEVRGNSMNVKYPEGTLLLCIRLLDFDRDLQDGDYVIAIRRRGGEVEATCKQLVMQDGKPWLWPRSTDPRHQQPVPGDLGEHDELNDDSLEIYAVVVAHFGENP